MSATAMALFEWSDQFSVRVPSIDRQHKKLVDMLNTLYDGMMTGAGVEQQKEVIDGLIQYTASHFQYEEVLFDKFEYEGTEEHKKEHAELVGQVVAFRERLENNEAAINMELINFLKDWLINHILGTDMLYSRHLVDHGVK